MRTDAFAPALLLSNPPGLATGCALSPAIAKTIDRPPATRRFGVYDGHTHQLSHKIAYLAFIDRLILENLSTEFS